MKEENKNEIFHNTIQSATREIPVQLCIVCAYVCVCV